jgi:Zn finger protein HypA/HybF involved in hydrogenase expression
LRQHCDACGRDTTVAAFTLACPDCGGSTRPVAGDELQMTYLELE